MPERLPIPAVQLADIHLVTVNIKRLRQDAIPLHFANIVGVWLEARHVPSLVFLEPDLHLFHHLQEGLIVRVLGILEQSLGGLNLSGAIVACLARAPSACFFRQRCKQERRLSRVREVIGQVRIPEVGLLVLRAANAVAFGHGHALFVTFCTVRLEHRFRLRSGGAIVPRYRIAANHPRSQRGIGPWIGRADMNPVADHLDFGGGELGFVVRAAEHFHQRAGGIAHAAGRAIASGVSPVRDQPRRRQGQEAMGVDAPMVAREQNAPAGFVGVVTLDAVFVEDRLNVAREVDGEGYVGEGFELARRAFHRHREARLGGQGGLGTIFMAAYATEDLAGHDAQEAVHSLDRLVFLVGGNKEQRAVGGQFEVGRAVWLDGDLADNARQGKRAAVAKRNEIVIPIPEVQGFGQRFEDDEFRDLALLDALHVSPYRYIAENQRAGRLGEIHAGGNDDFPFPLDHRARLVDPDFGGRRGIQGHDLARTIDHVDVVLRRENKTVFRERKGVTSPHVAHSLHRRSVIGAVLVGHRREKAPVLNRTMPRRVNQDHPVAARNVLGVDKDRPRMHIPKIGRLVRAVRVARPQMVKLHLRAVHIFPPREQNAAVGKNPGRVVLFDIRRQLLDVLAVRIATIKNRHLNKPTVHPAFGAAGDERDPAVGQISRFQVIVYPVGELFQARAVDVDLIEMELATASLSIGEENFLGVIVDVRVADRACLVLEQNGGLAAFDIELHQASADRVRRVMRAIVEVAEVRIPMAIAAKRTLGENDFRHTLFEQDRSPGGRISPCHRGQGESQRQQAYGNGGTFHCLDLSGDRGLTSQLKHRFSRKVSYEHGFRAAVCCWPAQKGAQTVTASADFPWRDSFLVCRLSPGKGPCPPRR